MSPGSEHKLWDCGLVSMQDDATEMYFRTAVERGAQGFSVCHLVPIPTSVISDAAQLV